ncbi:MAG: hypothetical protein GMKNLPBB_03193 [Myxococcota bacterium]|nr:hypothetical protein [Myxococcota bacterium]
MGREFADHRIPGRREPEHAILEIEAAGLADDAQARRGAVVQIVTLVPYRIDFGVADGGLVELAVAVVVNAIAQFRGVGVDGGEGVVAVARTGCLTIAVLVEAFVGLTVAVVVGEIADFGGGVSSDGVAFGGQPVAGAGENSGAAAGADAVGAALARQREAFIHLVIAVVVYVVAAQFSGGCSRRGVAGDTQQIARTGEGARAAAGSHARAAFLANGFKAFVHLTVAVVVNAVAA